jgi:V8-like Glu-specific endopeptidase
MAAMAGGELDEAVRRLQDALANAGKRAVRKLEADGAAAVLAPDEEAGLEAIVLVSGRPAILVRNGAFDAPPLDWVVLEDHRPAIEQTMRSVGRIEVDGHPTHEWIGTGFVVGDGVVMTNRHVAVEFARQSGAKWGFNPGMKVSIDYAEDLGTTNPAEFKVTEVIGVHNKHDLALLRVATTAKAPKPLPVSGNPATAKAKRRVYVTGYPAFDSRNGVDAMSRIFANVYNVKRLQPGAVMKVSGRALRLNHDCSTLGGNSGSCVVDLQTHQVVGLHFAGSYRIENSAVLLAGLRKDPLLKKAKVNFA